MIATRVDPPFPRNDPRRASFLPYMRTGSSRSSIRPQRGRYIENFIYRSRDVVLLWSRPVDVRSCRSLLSFFRFFLFFVSSNVFRAQHGRVRGVSSNEAGVDRLYRVYTVRRVAVRDRYS